MVTTSATALTNSGLRDWLIQRVTAVIIGLYTIFICAYLLFHPHFTFEAWHRLMTDPFMQIFTFLTLLSIIFHAWVGIWTVLTDYVHPYGLRLFLITLMIVALVGYLVWGIEVIWG